jgi:N-acetylated-alpha-linked acidic dipeptidase
MPAYRRDFLQQLPTVLVALSIIIFSFPVVDADISPLDGYSAPAALLEREWEKKFMQVPSTGNMRTYMKQLSAHPHHIGSIHDKENAEWILSRFQNWGFDAHIETFQVLFPTPKVRVLELLEPRRFTAKLTEPIGSVYLASRRKSEQLPTYNAYSRDGDVTGPLIYVNFGLPEDYELLERLGVSAKGAIVVARYGNSHRGIKPRVAAEHGAIGCILYSDPRDDGYFMGDVFPKGPMRPKDAVQRGSVMQMQIYPGDPLTPGVAATPDAKRLSIKDARTITRIPVLPVSSADAQPLLSALTGRLAPKEWRGALPIPYHVGPGQTKVHLKVHFNWDLKTIYDVVAKIPGTVEPDEWIIRGNHHDAWVYGADDPLSGLVALLEEARALGVLLNEGWQSRRTIVYCAWDGEEGSLLGSTEWSELHAEELRTKAAVYVNTDQNGRGYLSVNGSHSLEHLINGIARDLQDPETHLSVWNRLRLAEIGAATSQDERQRVRQRTDLRIGALGSGSDFTPFIDHLGVAALDLEYGGEDERGVYHSIFDNFFWFTHFSDTDFVYARTLAQTAGITIMRLADAEVLPYEFEGLADTIHQYIGELQTLLRSQHDEIVERNQQLKEGVFQATSDPRNPTVAPSRLEPPPQLNFAPLENAAVALTRSANRYEHSLRKLWAHTGSRLSPDSIRALNRKLIESERRLTSPDGLPQRPWYEHLIYAPGLYSGYGAKTFPGVREAIEQKRYAEASVEIERVSKALENEAALIDSAASDVEELEW